jgi:alpha-glucosidase
MALDPLAPVDPAAATSSVHHDGSARYVVALDGSDPDRLRIGDRVRLRVRAGLDVPIERIHLRTTPDGEQHFEELHEVAPGPVCRWFEITVRISMPTTGYRFLLLVPDGHRWLNAAGIHLATPTDREDFVLLTGYDPPRWLADRVFYQVFPDRFANGDPANDVRDGAWTYGGEPARHRAWDEPPGRGRASLVEFYGGDLPGITARLDHLAELGVNAIYLNPIFGTRSNHGYDIVDFDHVAAHLGGDDALVALRRATRERNIRLLLDITPNHVGVEHPWFASARADPSSPTRSFFTFGDGGDDYATWLGVRSLPKLDYRSPALRAAMYEGPDAVFRRWLRPPFEIDGWRIDVANMLGRLGPDQLGHDVARGIRRAIKDESPDAFLLGEHWFDAIDHLSGDAWDGVMNYHGFTTPLLEWLAGVDIQSHGSGIVGRTGRAATTTFVQTTTAFRSALAWSVARDQVNLLGSHDTARIASILGDDAGLVQAAFGALLTSVGVPAILYGDEIGLTGDDDLAARRTMPWDRSAWDMTRFAEVAALVRLRTTSRALRDGGFQLLEIATDSLAWLRDADDEWVVAIVARGPGGRAGRPLAVRHGAIPDGVAFREVLRGRSATVAGGCLEVGPTLPGAAIWVGRA